jgi:hypothetical protein
MKSLTTNATVTLAVVAALGGDARAQEDGKSCTPKTLRGTYVFAADGYNIVAGVPQPKAILEMMQFHGDGTLTVETATVSITARSHSHPLAVPDSILSTRAASARLRSPRGRASTSSLTQTEAQSG